MVSYATAPKGAFLCAGRGGDGIGSAKARGGRAPGPPAGGGSAPRPLRSCGAEVGGGRGVGRSRGCEGCKGCFSKGCEWLGLGNRLRRFPKGFWGMVGYGGERVGERVGGIGNRSGTGGAAGKDGPGERRKSKRYRGGCGKGWAGRAQETAASRGGGGGAERPQRRGQGPWPPAAPLVLGPGFARPQTPPPPGGVAGRGRKGASTPHSDALALQFFGKMGTIARRINL